jgi:flagellar P-ring protein precursor FlgI
VTVNHLSVGRIAAGATVEREVPMPLGQGEFVHFELNTHRLRHRPASGGGHQSRGLPGTATAADGRQVRVRRRESRRAGGFIGRIESIEVTPAKMAAKVIVNSRTGSVVMNQAVLLETVRWPMAPVGFGQHRQQP